MSEATLYLYRCQSNRTVKYLFLLGNEAADEAVEAINVACPSIWFTWYMG